MEDRSRERASETPVDAVGTAARRAADDLSRRHVGVVVAAVVPGRADPVTASSGSTRIGGDEPPTTRHLFEVASLTKIFTGLLLARAHLDGAVRLDDPVVRHLPSLGGTPPGLGAVTLEQLARHTSGLPRSPLPFLEDVPRQDPYSHVSQEDLLGALTRTRPRRAGHVRYSNFGPAVLGAALAHADPQAGFARMIRERITDPLGLTDTVLDPTQEQARRRVAGHRWRRRPSIPWRPSAMAPAVGLLSTADDLVALVRACLASVAGRTSEDASSPLAGPLALALGCEVGSPAPQHPPLAWSVREYRSRRTHWHTGASGGCRSFLALDLERGVGVVVLANSFTLRGADLVGMELLGRVASASRPDTD